MPAWPASARSGWPVEEESTEVIHAAAPAAADFGR
jgi:hypothetical protein